MTDEIDLDSNATTRPLPEVVEVVARVMRDAYGNPGSVHRTGRRARQVLEQSREFIAESLGANPEELIFTSGGTESNNLGIRGLARGQAATIALTPGEHPSSLEACRRLQRRGWQLRELSVTADGQVRCELPESTRLAVILLAHNETGVIQNLDPLRTQCQARGIPLHLDGVQAVGKIPVDFHATGAATLSFGAHKFHGPRGIGGLLVREGVTLQPHSVGGHQESERRPGTPPVALIAGMACALKGWQQRNAEVESRRDQFQSLLVELCAPVVVHGRGSPRLPNTLNVSFPGVDGEALLVALDLEGIACSLGTTCASGSAEPAAILVAMGLPSDLYRSALRFSLSFENSPDQLQEAAARIARVVGRLRKPR